MTKNIKAEIRVVRVDPSRKTIAAMMIRIGKNANPLLRKICRAEEIGWREIMTVNGAVICAAAALEVEPAIGAWRFKGSDDTAGVSVLFTRGPGNGMLDFNESLDWVRARVEWIPGEDFAGLQQRALEIMGLMNDGLVDAVLAAIPDPMNGAMWIPLDHKAEFEALQAIGIGTQSSGGQRLSPVGVEIHSLLTREGK